jgi:hypothetical protein
LRVLTEKTPRPGGLDGGLAGEDPPPTAADGQLGDEIGVAVGPRGINRRVSALLPCDNNIWNGEPLIIIS